MSTPFITARTIGTMPDIIELASNCTVVNKAFDSAGLPELSAITPDLFLPEISVIRLMEEAARAVGDRDFGFFLAERFTLAEYGEWGRYLIGASTLLQAMSRCANAIKFHSSHGRFFAIPNGDEVALVYDDKLVRGVVGYRHFAVRSAFRMINIVRGYTGANWQPLRAFCDEFSGLRIESRGSAATICSA